MPLKTGLIQWFLMHFIWYWTSAYTLLLSPLFKKNDGVCIRFSFFEKIQVALMDKLWNTYKSKSVKWHETWTYAMISFECCPYLYLLKKSTG